MSYARPDPRDQVYFGAIKRSVPAPVRWLLLLFVFTIPFEAAQTIFTSGSLSLAKISGLVFTLLFFLYYNPVNGRRSLPTIPSAMWWFLGYLAVYTISGWLVPQEYFGSVLSRLITLLQLIVFFWIASALLEDGKLARSVLGTYVIASGILAIGVIFGLPGFDAIEGGRVAVMGENPNDVGAMTALAAVGLIGLRLGGDFKFCKSGLFLFLLGLLLAVLVKTSSRAAIGAFTIGSSAYVLLFWQSRRKFSTIFMAALGVFTLIYLVAMDPLTSERWQESYYEGNVAGRDKIFSAAIEMILERPIFGWQPSEFSYELGLRVGKWDRDPHNLFLHLLLEVGLVGAFPFLIGLGLCFRAAWKASRGDLGFIPMALLLTTIVVNMANTHLARKPLWFILALVVGSAAGATAAKRQARFIGALSVIRSSERSA